MSTMINISGFIAWFIALSIFPFLFLLIFFDWQSAIVLGGIIGGIWEIIAIKNHALDFGIGN